MTVYLENSSRFEWVVGGAPRGPDNVFDVDLGNHELAAIVPTRGAIIPEWLLVIPRSRCLSVAELSSSARRGLLSLASTVADEISSVGKKAIIFEHGPAQTHSLTGCGVDQAHLHAVGTGHEFIDWVLEGSDLRWTEVSPSDPWNARSTGLDYLLMMAGSRAWLAQPELPLSQFFRRKVAAYVGRTDEWDYRLNPHVANAARTTELFERPLKWRGAVRHIAA